MIKKRIAIIVSVSVLILAANNVSSAWIVPRKLMEFGDAGWEDEMARLDYLESKLRAEPESIGYIIVYGGQRGTRRGDTEARMKCIKDYMFNRRGVHPKRMVMVNGGYREESTVELWLASRGERGPTATPTISAKDVKFVKGKSKNWRRRCNF